MYVYLNRSLGIWTVGFFDPKGKWQPESNHCSSLQAAERVAWLNGTPITIFDSDSLSLKELLLTIQTELWEPEKNNSLGRLKNIICDLCRNYIYVEQVSQKEFLRYRNAGQKSWILFLEVMSKTKERQKKFLIL
jgi:hypothetical protein